MVDGIYEDSRGVPSSRDLTTQVAWSSDQGAVVGVSARGMMTGGDEGTATVTVSHAGVTASNQIRVLGTGVASPVADAYAVQNNAAHTSYATFGGVTLPGAAAWSATFPGPVLHPIIAQDSIFVPAADSQPQQRSISLYAHDLLSGARIWGPVVVDSPQQNAYFGYERGRVLTLNDNCVLRAYSAADGTVLWTTNLATASVWSCTSHVTTWRGIAYVNVAGVASTVMAIDVASGSLLWKSYLRAGSSSLLPTVDDGGVYVTYTRHVYRLDPRSGALQWHRAGPGSGGSSTWSVLYDGRLYVLDRGSANDGLILDSQSGRTLGTFRAGFRVPPIDPTHLYIVEGSEIRAVDLQGGGTAWLVSAPDRITSAPIVVDDTVFYMTQKGSSLRALRASDGIEIWQTPLGPPVADNTPEDVMAAGHGLLAVPAGNTLSVFRLHD